MNYQKVCELMDNVGDKFGQAPSGMWAEKFAELIITECADLFDDDPESGTRYTGVACKGIIKHYFGVEE